MARKLSRRKPGKKKPVTRRVSARQQEIYDEESRRESDLAAKASKKAERQRQRRAEQREAAELAARHERAGGDERDVAIEWLEYMTPPGWSLDLVEPEVAARIPWVAVGKFYPSRDIGYAELHAIFVGWRNDVLLETRINPQRISQIRIAYADPNETRGSGDSIVSHTGPWELVVSEAATEMNPQNPDSLAARYKHTGVPYFYVYFARQIARSSSWLPSYQRD